MVTTTIDPEKPVSDDRHRDPAKRREATEMMATKKRSYKQTVTTRRRRTSITRGFGPAGSISGSLAWMSVKGAETIFRDGSCDALCARRDDEEPMIRREQAVGQQLQEGDAWS